MSADLEPTGDQAEPVGSDQGGAVGNEADGQGGELNFETLTDEQIETLTPEQLKAMRASFTQKTQTLAEQRKEVEERSGRLAWAEQLLDDYQNEPEKAMRVLEAMLARVKEDRGEAQRPQYQPTDTGPQVNWNEVYSNMTENEQYLAQALGTLAQHNARLEEQVQQVLSRTASTEEVFAAREVENQLAKLKDQYGEFDERAVLEIADRYEGKMSLEEAYKLAHFEQAQKSGQAKAYQEIERKRQLPGATITGPKVATRPKPHGLDELFAQVMNEAG